LKHLHRFEVEFCSATRIQVNTECILFFELLHLWRFLFASESYYSDTKHRAGEHIVMAPKKSSKKGEEQPEGDIISDTTATGVIHNVKSWATITLPFFL